MTGQWFSPVAFTSKTDRQQLAEFFGPAAVCLSVIQMYHTICLHVYLHVDLTTRFTHVCTQDLI